MTDEENYIGSEDLYEQYYNEFVGMEVDEFGKARKERKATRQKGRIERKSTKQTNKQERKLNRANNKNLVRLEKARSKQVETEQQLADPETENPTIEPKQAVKMVNYVKAQREEPISNNPEELAAQFRDLRGSQIAQRRAQHVEALRNRAVSEDEDFVEMETPTYDEVEEEILEEEENNFNFTGEEDNFLDPETIGVISAIGKKSADVYREKRFAKGKKAFGKTKKQFDTAQAKKLAIDRGEIIDDSAAAQIKAEAIKQITDVKTKETINDNLPLIVGAVIGLITIGVVLYQSGNK